MQMKKIEKRVPKIVLNLEKADTRVEYEKFMRQKFLFGQLKSSDSKKLSDWIDGQELAEKKRQQQELEEQINEMVLEKEKIKEKQKLQAISRENYQTLYSLIKSKKNNLQKSLERVRREIH